TGFGIDFTPLALYHNPSNIPGLTPWARDFAQLALVFLINYIPMYSTLSPSPVILFIAVGLSCFLQT
ncbi:hypothetical protein, partial [Saccharicrinis sp. GN24d3]|uniref:hypothetical protein n=1 Tax=Saccharicrinis sp. GN24d3 TaxID=3458416 RepID=UPI0040359916